MKATRIAEPCNWVNDSESHLQNEEVIVALIFLRNHLAENHLLKTSFFPIQDIQGDSGGVTATYGARF
jgi:hypothetical protein